MPGQVAGLVTASFLGGVRKAILARGAGSWRFTGFVVLVLDGKEFDLTENHPAHLAGYLVQSRPRVWKRLHHVGTICVSLPDRKRRRRDQDGVGNVPAQIRTGVG